MRLSPVGTKLVVEKIKEKLKSQTIILDETVTARENSFARVLAVGDKVVDIPVGSVVILPPNAGALWEDERREYHIVEQEYVLAVSTEGGANAGIHPEV